MIRETGEGRREHLMRLAAATSAVEQQRQFGGAADLVEPRSSCSCRGDGGSERFGGALVADQSQQPTPLHLEVHP